MRRSTPLLGLLVAAVALTPAAPAAAATKGSKAAKPKVTRVTPMRVTVGDTLTIRGKRFKAKPRANTIIFQGAGGRTAFAKPRVASKRKLVVKIPASVSRLLVVRASSQVPTRIKLRVLAGRFSAFTPRRLSPVVTSLTDAPGGAAKVCKDDADHDNDLLNNVDELEYKTDPCLDDTDGDGLSDGWEFYSAKDLNIKAVPYPGARPFPNPLDPSDTNIDFDGDGLGGGEEYRAWLLTGSSFDSSKLGDSNLESALGYSDGTQYSRASEVPSVPAWKGPAYGLPAPPQSFPATYDLHGDAGWRDDERDADRDGLSNWLEAKRGPSNPAWWKSLWALDEFQIEPWPERIVVCDQAPGAFEERPFAILDVADPDVDGDTLLDGEDDQDNDDVSNIVELYETTYDLDGNGQVACGKTDIPALFAGGTDRVVNPFNPCAPNRDSRTCPVFEPF